MPTTNNPQWWKNEYDGAWDRVKAAFQRDWDQTKHDMGGKTVDTNQDVPDTVKQASGNQPIPPRGVPNYEENENAYRFGYGAKMHYGKRFSAWNGELESQLEEDWESVHPDDNNDWETSRSAIREGWEYQNAPTRAKK